jgi:hypothetical protein
MFSLRRCGAALFWLLASCSSTPNHSSSISFFDDFENGLDKWDLNNPAKLQIVASGDDEHRNVLALYPGGHNVHALIKQSDGWTNFKIEGDVLFTENEHNYMGLIYNYNVRDTRVDYGCIYIKGNDSYVRVNPHRDGHVSRVLYDEYKTALTGNSAIVTGEWQHFKAEVMDSICHFYVGDMETPQLTYAFHEFSSGRVGFEPRVSGSECWIDNISVSAIAEFAYKGPNLPSHVTYHPEELITKWQAIGPFRRRIEEIEKDGYLPDKFYTEGRTTYQWQPFKTDARGCVVGGKIIEWMSDRNDAYFYTEIVADSLQNAKLQFSTTNDLKVWLNEKYTGEIARAPSAWHDFWKNSEHKGSELEVALAKGANHLLILEQGLGFRGYSGDGFYARIALQD